MTTPELVRPNGELDAAELARYSRQVILGELGLDGQARLKAARVLVIGAGGLGSPVLLYLAAAGVGAIGVIDSDTVEASNLHRQVIHPTASIGRPKVDSAADAIAALNPGVTLRRHRLRLDADTFAELLPDYDLVVDGSDNFATRYLVNDGCTAAGKPLVWGSVLGFAAQVAVFWRDVPGGVDLRDVFPEPPAAGEVPSCAEAGVIGAVCAQAGSVMAMEAIKLITGIGRPLLGRVLVIDALAGRWDEVPVRGRGAEVSTGSANESRVSTSSTNESRVSTSSTNESRVSTSSTSEVSTGPDTLTLPGTEEFYLLDVRSPDEFATQHIPGSHNVPLPDLLDQAPALPPDRPVLVICRSGARAGIAAASLRARGHPDVQVLEGGLLALTGPAPAE